jgi:NAD(P)-dependent dehydrogenase (short-subunit alcohol dehydrogenase family)
MNVHSGQEIDGAMKTILITGATAGIGRHAALELVRQGHHVIATGRREAALQTLAEEAATLGKESGGLLDTLRLDVTDPASIAAAVDEVDNKLTAGRGLDVLVNNAGYGQMGPVEEVSDADVRRQYETNVFGLLAVTRAFVPRMRERGEGRVVNVSSIGGRFTFPLMGIYNSTKYAVESISDALRNELAPFGVAVSIVEPGPIATEFNDVAMETINVERFSGSPYEAIVARADKFRAKFESGASRPEVTTRAIVHACVARRPGIRYVAPRMLGIVLFFLTFIPTALLDFVMQRASGLTRKTLEEHTAKKALLPPASGKVARAA